MACLSIAALTQAACNEGTPGGVEKLYIVAYQDLDSSAGDPYTTAVNGQISAVSLTTGKKFVELELAVTQSTGLNEELVISEENGSRYFNQSMNVTLVGLTAANRDFLHSVLFQPVVVIAKTNSGVYAAAGLNKSFKLTKETGGTGIKLGDLNGYQLEFTGYSKVSLPFVDSTIIAGLIA